MRNKRPLLTLILASFTFAMTLGVSIATNEHLQVSLFNKPIQPVYGVIYDSLLRIDPENYGFDTDAGYNEELVYHGKFGTWSYCDYELPDEAEFNASLMETHIPDDIQGGDSFKVTMSFENTGNTRLFSAGAECPTQKVLNLGTQNMVDRHSIFGLEDNALSGWLKPERIEMVEDYVDPGERFTVQFESIAPEGDNIYREFFQLVIEGQEWVGEMFILDFEVGEPSEEDYDNIQYVQMTSIDAASLRGLQRNLEIELATQTLTAKMGDIEIWEMIISSGHYETPTPRGNYTIFQKQELRVGGEAPHYRMPYWMFWEKSGYGIHGLPYLGSDGGWFWKEAESHLGIPVSHGCIRVGDDNVKLLYEFSPIGTSVYIY